MTVPRAAFRAGAYALLPGVLSGIPFGLIAGAAGRAAGLSLLEIMASSILIFSGIAQLIIYQLFRDGTPIVVILLTAFIVGLRLVMYSAALAPHFEHVSARWKIALAYFSTDHGFAATMVQRSKSKGTTYQEWFHLGGGVAQWVPWQLCVVLGALVGGRVPPSWSLDFAVPLSFLAMLVPVVKDRATVVASITGGSVALLAVGLPFRLSLIVAAVVGITAGYLVDRRAK
ncbi:MAG: AzlC family ABC transporter permease [Gammaproteobacteria bacterium]|nr:AzlC family ABC transporter permease [Gammaproteobacteria bacterium]